MAQYSLVLMREPTGIPGSESQIAAFAADSLSQERNQL